MLHGLEGGAGVVVARAGPGTSVRPSARLCTLSACKRCLCCALHGLSWDKESMTCCCCTSYHAIVKQAKTENMKRQTNKKHVMFTLLDVCVSSLRRGHANLLCIVPILTDDSPRESSTPLCLLLVYVWLICCVACSVFVAFVRLSWLASGTLWATFQT